jgi:hypothetical protein
VLVIDIIVEIVLNYHVYLSKAVASFHNLDVEHFRASCENAGKHCMKLLFLDIYLLTDAEEDLNLIVKQIVRIACIFITVILELRELRDCVSIQLIIAGLSRWQRFIRVVRSVGRSVRYKIYRLLRERRDFAIRSRWR